MKRLLIKILVCCIVFFSTLYITSIIMNKGNTDMTAEIGHATFPVAYIGNNDISYNTMYGYTSEINGSLNRDSITPLDQSRRLSFVLKKYDNVIDNISFEVRSIDGKRLVEQTDVSDYEENNDQIKATVTIKDLIDAKTEYNFILLVQTKGETLRYYTRIVQDEDYAVSEKLKFVIDFHKKTFDKEAAGSLISYLESNSQGDNTTYSYVNIHSSFSQITWGDLKPEQITESKIEIKEITKQTATIELKCMVSVLEGKIKHYYNVKEYFRVRYTKDRMYLLQYERTMHQIFDPNQDVFANHKIMLGITDMDTIDMKESDGGSIVAFINENQLFSYNEADNKVSYLFGFSDEFDERSLNEHHAIKILNVDETGDVTFVVYGYMNRGRYEGEVGVQLYEYNGMTNTIEEQIFIPYKKSVSELKYDMEQLSFVNNNNAFYLYLDGSIFAVDLLEKSYTEIVNNLQEGNFEISEKDEMLVWQNTTEPYNSTKLILMNLNTMKRKEITCGENQRILPLGFMGEDLIYGIANQEDIVKDNTGAVTFAMKEVNIQNEQGEILKKYKQDGIYVTGCEIVDNMISLHRVIKVADGYQETKGDQIVNNLVEESGYNSIEIVATQNFEKIVQIVLKSEISSKNIKVMTPKEVLFEGSREVDIEIEDEMERFFVFTKGEIIGCHTDPAKAINIAYEQSGTVLDKDGAYVWYKGRNTKNQIMAIEGKSIEEKTSLAVCLDTMLGFEGITKDTQQLLQNGESITDILSKNMLEATVMDLSGCKLDAILCYCDQDIPVLAVMNDGSAVLIIGFNELNVVLMDPKTGTVYKKGMNDSSSMFEENGNRFITYYRKNK